MTRRTRVFLIASVLIFLNSGSLAHARVEDPEFYFEDFVQTVWGEERYQVTGLGYIRGEGHMTFPVGYQVTLNYTGFSTSGGIPINLPVQLSNPTIIDGMVYVSWEFACPVPSGTYEMSAIVNVTSAATGITTPIPKPVGTVVVPSWP